MMSITQDDFKKVWASTSSVPEYTFSDSDYQDGWEFVGNLPPTRAMWDTLQRRNDQKMKYLQDNGSMCFDSVADMVASNLESGQTVITKGYYSVNDGGSALYTIRAKDVADVEDGGSIIFLNNGNVAELITDDYSVSVKQFGAKGDGVANDTVAVQNACAFAKKVFFPDGTYSITDYIPVYANVLVGDNATINVAYSEWKERVFRFYADNYIKISGLSVAVNHLATTGFAIDKNDNANILNHIEITNCSIADTDNVSSQLTSCGIFVYRQHHNSVVKNCIIDGVYRHSSNPGITHSCGIQVTDIDGTAEISNNIISNVYMNMNIGDDADADGIAVYSYNGLTDEKDLSSVTISNNKINNCQGRWIKSQASVLNVTRNICKNENISLITNFAGIDLQTGVGTITSNSMFLFGVTGGTSGKFINLTASSSVSANPCCEAIGNKMYSDNAFAYGIIPITNHDLHTTFVITNNDFHNTKNGIYFSSRGTANNIAYVIIGNNIFNGSNSYYYFSGDARKDYIQLLDTGSVGNIVNGFGNFYYFASLGNGYKEYLTNLLLSENKAGTFVGMAGISGSGFYPVIVVRNSNGVGYVILFLGSHIYELLYVNSTTSYLYTYNPASTE